MNLKKQYIVGASLMLALMATSAQAMHRHTTLTGDSPSPEESPRFGNSRPTPGQHPLSLSSSMSSPATATRTPPPVGATFQLNSTDAPRWTAAAPRDRVSLLSSDDEEVAQYQQVLSRAPAAVAPPPAGSPFMRRRADSRSPSPEQQYAHQGDAHQGALRAPMFGAPSLEEYGLRPDSEWPFGVGRNAPTDLGRRLADMLTSQQSQRDEQYAYPQMVSFAPRPVSPLSRGLSEVSQALRFARQDMDLGQPGEGTRVTTPVRAEYEHHEAAMSQVLTTLQRAEFPSRTAHCSVLRSAATLLLDTVTAALEAGERERAQAQETQRSVQTGDGQSQGSLFTFHGLDPRERTAGALKQLKDEAVALKDAAHQDLWPKDQGKRIEKPDASLVVQAMRNFSDLTHRLNGLVTFLEDVSPSAAEAFAHDVNALMDGSVAGAKLRGQFEAKTSVLETQFQGLFEGDRREEEARWRAEQEEVYARPGTNAAWDAEAEDDFEVQQSPFAILEAHPRSALRHLEDLAAHAEDSEDAYAEFRTVVRAFAVSLATAGEKLPSEWARTVKHKIYEWIMGDLRGLTLHLTAQNKALSSKQDKDAQKQVRKNVQKIEKIQAYLEAPGKLADGLNLIDLKRDVDGGSLAQLWFRSLSDVYRGRQLIDIATGRRYDSLAQRDADHRDVADKIAQVWDFVEGDLRNIKSKKDGSRASSAASSSQPRSQSAAAAAAASSSSSTRQREVSAAMSLPVAQQVRPAAAAAASASTLPQAGSSASRDTTFAGKRTKGEK